MGTWAVCPHKYSKLPIFGPHESSCVWMKDFALNKLMFYNRELFFWTTTTNTHGTLLGHSWTDPAQHRGHRGPNLLFSLWLVDAALVLRDPPCESWSAWNRSWCLSSSVEFQGEITNTSGLNTAFSFKQTSLKAERPYLNQACFCCFSLVEWQNFMIIGYK